MFAPLILIFFLIKRTSYCLTTQHKDFIASLVLQLCVQGMVNKPGASNMGIHDYTWPEGTRRGRKRLLEPTEEAMAIGAA